MDAIAKIGLICSNRPRPSVQKGAKGHQHWARDVFHAAGDAGKTMCGANADGWLTILDRHPDDALSDPHFCLRCAAKINAKLGRH